MPLRNIGYQPHHFSRVYDREVMNQLWAEHGDILDATAKSKFRNKEIIAPDIIELTQASLGMTRPYCARKRERYLEINRQTINDIKRIIANPTVKEVCLNDAGADEDFIECRQAIIEAFEGLFPKSQSLRNNMKKVSIIVPVYNREKTIKKCLDSLVNQTYTNIEILVINNNSTDETVNIVRKLAKENAKIQLLNCKEQGVSYSRNCGIKKATGDYLMFKTHEWVVCHPGNKNLHTAVVIPCGSCYVCPHRPLRRFLSTI